MLKNAACGCICHFITKFFGTVDFAFIMMKIYAMVIAFCLLFCRFLKVTFYPAYFMLDSLCPVLCYGWMMTRKMERETKEFGCHYD